jgi:hypothetical protein
MATHKKDLTLDELKKAAEIALLKWLRKPKSKYALQVFENK